ncbi:MAG: putative cardiolipin synthetase 2 [Caloramator sp.]|jgi:cardiolipin synthase|uniref:cardiolipin synthase n=1 Tax=Caloramator sp. TaxID=1871330 RepID=UPI001D4F3939|nr:cardiolipin synthase [Caloramator sp.]MBZ4662606.1 putative cardiolipin synthetase 2 [Caloramator sp.]
MNLLSAAIIINTIVLTTIIILERKRPEKTIAWLLLIAIFPPLGFILYLFLGRNWKRHKLNEEFSPIVKDLINRVINRIDKEDYKYLAELLANNSDSPLFVDNDIEIFGNGEDKFNALFKEIELAEHHIHLEYYIVKSDDIGNRLKDLLIKKSKEGVRVRFIIDRVGAIKLSRRYIKDLRENGVDVVQYSYFLAPLLRRINTQINYRNHRKVAVIDGKVGFIGGMNIGDEYRGLGKIGEWKDLHIKVTGDFVLGLQGVFIDDYMAVKRIDDAEFFMEGEFDKYFPPSEKSKGKIMQLVKSGPNSEHPSIMQGIVKMIYMAKKNIYITTPYFVPTESVMDALKIAKLSGIDVKILFPGKYDHFLVYHASKTYLEELVRCGVEVYFYNKKAFVHSKVMTIDDSICTIGTANMDIRSFELNYEVNAVIYDKDTTLKVNDLFKKDLEESRRVDLEYFNSEPKYIKIVDGVCRIFSELL